MRRKTLCLGLALVLGLALASAASAQLVPHGALGPINTYDPVAKTGNGYPLYVQDLNGVRLDLPVPPIGAPLGAPVVVPSMSFDAPIPGNQLSQDTGFGGEAFFYLANSTMNIRGGRAVLTLGVEAAYGSGDPLNNPTDQFLFARLRLDFDPPVTGTYTLTTPWGNQTLNVDAIVAGGFRIVLDWGGFAPIPNATPPIPSSFERILYSPVPWRFLRATTMAPTVLPTEWVGDGSTPTTVTGGFNGVNKFRIDGPAGSNLDGAGNDFVETVTFTVSGHIFPTPAIPGALLLLEE